MTALVLADMYLLNKIQNFKDEKARFTLKIIIGMVLRVLYGLLASKKVDFTNDWIKPCKIFINLLKLIAVPLVLASLIKGLAA